MSYSDNEPTVTAMERVIKQRDKLIEENERLRAEVFAQTGHLMDCNDENADLQARLSAAEDKFDTLADDLHGQLDRAEEENEKLVLEILSCPHKAENERLKTEGAGLPELDDLQARLFAAEKVVEAAKNVRVIGFEPGIAKVDSGSWAGIVERIRHYEEGKAGVKYGKHVLDPKTGEWRTEWHEEEGSDE